MKRTISEVIELIKQKKESAERKHRQIYEDFINRDMPMPRGKRDRYNRLLGYDEAYTDVLCLLESSHLVEQEKVLEIFKKYFTFEIWDMGKDYIVNVKDPEYSNYNNCQMYVTEEEKKVLEDWINGNK